MNTIHGGAPVTDSMVVGMAIDKTAKKIWYRRNGVWDDDPAAGTGGFAISSAAEFYFWFLIRARTYTSTVNPGQTFSGSVPSGFSAYNA